MMKAALTKEVLLEELPLCEDQLTIREWSRQDLDKLADWPDYPFPFQGFEFSFRSMNSLEKNGLFQAQQENPDRIILVVDHLQDLAVGNIALTHIDWMKRSVGNFGLRIHPDWCDKGLGTSVLLTVSRWVFIHGIEAISVNVAASNSRAIRCYEKVGFRSVSEMWQDAPDLIGVDPSLSRYDFLQSHLRQENEIPKLRFILMDLKRKE